MSAHRPSALSAELASLSDEEFAHLRSDSPRRLQATSSREEAAALYADEIIYLEREGIWRDRVNDPNADIDLLFVTVGNQVDTPVSAILRWRARYVVLLHSDKTRNHAQSAATLIGLQLGDGELRLIGQGTDPALLYKTVKEVWVRQGKPVKTVIDITGGFKAMSGAAAAVGFVIPGAQVAYVETSQPRLHGRPFWLDTQVLLLENPLQVFGDLDRDTARRLLEAHRFGPATQAWSTLAANTRAPEDRWWMLLSSALEAADCLHFQQSADRLDELIQSIPLDVRHRDTLASSLLVSEEARQWMVARRDGLRAVATLSGENDPLREHSALSSPAMLDLIALLLGLAERRLSAGESDLAILYAYRCSEGIIQRRVTMLGYNVSRFDWDMAFTGAEVDPSQQDSVLERMRLNRPLRETIDRGVGIQLLFHLFKDPLIASGSESKTLINLGSARNKSILAHGLSQVGPRTAQALIASAKQQMQVLLTLEDGETGQLQSHLSHWFQALPPSINHQASPSDAG
jgi:hypothetical protein